MSSLRSRRGGTKEGDDVEAVEEVFAEVAAGDLFFEVLVGGGDDADVDVDGVGGADGEEALLVESAEDLGLGLRLMSPTSSRKRVPPSARSKVPRFSAGGLGRSGAGSVAVAEELGFDVVLGDGGAVELDEGRSRRRDSACMARAMSSLPVPDSPKMRTRPLVGAMSLICWRSAFMGTDWPVTEPLGGELALELGIVFAQAAGLHGVFEDDEGAVDGEGLFEEVVGAELGGADGGLDGAVAGDDDDFGDGAGDPVAGGCRRGRRGRRGRGARCRAGRRRRGRRGGGRGLRRRWRRW